MLASPVIVVSVLRALIEVAGLFLLGQGVLWLLAGPSRERNVIYRLFQIITGPVIRLVRALTPHVILDRHIPWVNFFLLLWLWLSLAYLRLALCGAQGAACT